MRDTLTTSPDDPAFILEEDAEQAAKNIAAIRLLQSWFEEDEQEQRETLAHLRVALDEDRLSDRPVFS